VLFTRLYSAQSAPRFERCVVIGCDNLACSAPLRCANCQDLQEIDLSENTEAVVAIPNRCVVKTEMTRSISVAMWLFKKGYQGFEWYSKAEYDESGPLCRMHRRIF
jgi:hypothetical protein